MTPYVRDTRLCHVYDQNSWNGSIREKTRHYSPWGIAVYILCINVFSFPTGKEHTPPHSITTIDFPISKDQRGAWPFWDIKADGCSQYCPISWYLGTAMTQLLLVFNRKCVWPWIAHLEVPLLRENVRFRSNPTNSSECDIRIKFFASEI